MFLYNLHWRWGFFDQVQPSGVIFHAVGFDKETADRRTFPEAFPEFILIDPDTYLWSLDYESCGKACINIATHDWVPIDTPEFDSNEGTRRQWLEEEVGPSIAGQWPPTIPPDDESLRGIVENCLQWQQDLGASRLILPTTLISDPRGDLSEFLRWIDQGLEVAESFNTPMLISIPISDICIDSHLESIIDHITARDEIQGVYVCIDTSRSSASVPIGSRVINSLLEISYLIGNEYEREVFVNFGDLFGLVCLALGATGFATGYEVKTRRLNLEEFVQREGGGGAFPRFFSFATNTLYLASRDMDRIQEHRLLRIFNNDRTLAANPLLAALREGGSADDVPSWRESRNNVAAARSHLIERINNAVNEIRSLGGIREKIEWVLNWLQNAESNVAYLNSRFEDDPLDDDGRHVRPWRAAFESFIDRYDLL